MKYAVVEISGKQSLQSHFVEFFQTLVVFAAIGTAIYWLIAQPHRVEGSSMYPTFKDGDYIITDKVSYKVGEPQRGDVIVFKDPANNSQDFIKRVMALSGDTLEVKEGKVYLNDKELPEDYIDNDIVTRPGTFLKDGQSIFVEPGKFLVFGDNRPHSSDSRAWGYIEKKEIIGKVFFRYWPINQIGIFDKTKNTE